MPINVYSQKLGARKAARVNANQRFLLRVKSPASDMEEAERLAKEKKIVARTRITINARMCSGMSDIFRCDVDPYVAYSSVSKQENPLSFPTGHMSNNILFIKVSHIF